MSSAVGQFRTDPAHLRIASSATAAGTAVPGSNLADRMKNDICYFCKQRGHWFKQCPNKRPGRVTGPPDSRGVAIDSPCLTDRLCPCGAGVCLIKTSQTPTNPGRKFYSCPLYRSGGHCNFFEWCDKASSSLGVNLKVNGAVTSYPECSCGAGKCCLYTTSEGRKYFGCPIKKGQGACNFFQWSDPLENDSKDSLLDQRTEMVNCNKFEGEGNKLEGSLTNLSINEKYAPLGNVKSELLSLEVAKDPGDDRQSIMTQDPGEVGEIDIPQANNLGPTTKELWETETWEVDLVEDLTETAYLQLEKLTDVASNAKDMDGGERINEDVKMVEQAIQSEQGRQENGREEKEDKEIKHEEHEVVEEEMEMVWGVAELQMAKKEYMMQMIIEEKQQEKEEKNIEDVKKSAEVAGERGGNKQGKGEVMKMVEHIRASADALLAFYEDDAKMMESDAKSSFTSISVLNGSPKTISEGLAKEDVAKIVRLNSQNQGNAELRPGDHGEPMASEEFYELLSTVQTASVLAKHMEIISSTCTSLRTMIEEDSRNMTLVELEITRAKSEVVCLKTALYAAEFKLKQAEEKKATLKMSLKIGIDALLPNAQQAREQLKNEHAKTNKNVAKARQVLGSYSFGGCDSTKDFGESSSSIPRDRTSETPDLECGTCLKEKVLVGRCASNASIIERTFPLGETTDEIELGGEDVNNGLQIIERPNIDVNFAGGCVPRLGKDFGCGEGMLWIKESILSWICYRRGIVDYWKKDER